MSFPRADELKTPPVVGKFYMVPCIWAGREWWPITGPQHEDAEIIGFKTQHRHYDLRFVSPLQMDRLCERGWWKRALHWPDDAVQTEKSDGDAHSRVCIKIGTPRYRRLKCWREQPPYQIDGVARPMWVAPLEQKLASAKVKCGKCPHRGLPLESLPRVPGTDIVTCDVSGTWSAMGPQEWGVTRKGTTWTSRLNHYEDMECRSSRARDTNSFTTRQLGLLAVVVKQK